LNSSGHSHKVPAVGLTGGVRIGFPEYRANGPIAQDGSAARRALLALRTSVAPASDFLLLEGDPEP